MSRHIMPFVLVNYGCEMMFVLGARLEAQLIEPLKGKRIKIDIVSRMFSAAFLDELFRPQKIYTNGALRRVFATVSDSSIMKLSENSMKKLYDLMAMTVKYQVLSLHHPFELLEYSVNHLEELRRTCPREVHACIANVAERMQKLSASLTLGEMAQVRHGILNFLQDRRIKVSLFLESGTQFPDGNFDIPRATYLPPTSVTHAPGMIHFYEAGQHARTTRFPHRDAALTHPPNVAVGRWGPAHFSCTAPRMTACGGNLYATARDRDALVAQSREVPGPNAVAMAAAAAEGSPRTVSEATPAELQAYQNEMNYLSQLAGKHAQPQEKIRLSLFEGDDGYDDNTDAVAVAPAAPANFVSQPTLRTSPAGPHAAPSAENVSGEAGASPMVKLFKMDAGAVKQENKQLLGIISGLDARGAPRAADEADGGDNLLDIMDEI